MLPEPNNFLALEETVGAGRSYDIWSYVKSLTKFLYSSRYVFTKHPVQLKTVTTYFRNMFFSKRAPKQKGGCLDTLDTTPPWIRHWSATALFVVLAAQHGDVVGNGDHSAVRCQDRVSRLGHHESGLQHGALHLRTDHADAGCRRLTVYAHRV